MNEAARDLSVRRSEYDSLLQGRVRLAQRFEQHQNQIEQTGRALLEIYREANRKARANACARLISPSPTPWSGSAMPARPEASARDNLRSMIAETQELLSQQNQGHSRGIRSAVRTYREIDELLPE